MNNSNKNKDLKHLLDNNSVFTDKSIELNDYLRDLVEIKIGASNVYYLGYTKPINQIYIEMSKFNASNASIEYKYFDGTSYVAVPNLFDDTKNLTRNGFVRWEFNDLENIRDKWKASIVDGVELFWVQVTANAPIFNNESSETVNGVDPAIIEVLDATPFNVGDEVALENHSYQTIDAIDYDNNLLTISPGLPLAPADGIKVGKLVEFKGINILYCDEMDLKITNPKINQYLGREETSFLKYRVDARNHIVQALRSGGVLKELEQQGDFLPNSEVFNTNTIRKFTKWDFLDIEEIREAAKYLTLSKIFYENSQNVDDKPYERARYYEGRYGMSFKSYILTLDLDDDGETDTYEEYNDNSIMVYKT
jgi:hypothetical protein